jgi:hypothetical protein
MRCTPKGNGEGRAPTTGVHAHCTQTGDLDRSISACTAALNDQSETSSNKAIAYNNRGSAYWAKGEVDRAIVE